MSTVAAIKKGVWGVVPAKWYLQNDSLPISLLAEMAVGAEGGGGGDEGYLEGIQYNASL